jgi:hypothetical protein
MNVAGLPHDADGNLAVDTCELNERLDPIGPLAFRQTKVEAVRTIAAVSITAAVLGLVPRLVIGTFGPLALDVPLWLAAGFVGLTACHFLTGSRFAAHYLGVSLTMTILWTAARVQATLVTGLAGYETLFAAGLLATAALSHLVAKQYVFYTAANILNDWSTGNICRRAWDELEQGWSANKTPEVAAYHRAALALLPAFAVGLLFARVGYYGALGYLLALSAMTPFVWPSGASVGRASVACAHAARVFLTYDRAGAKAPGFFRFPTVWLRAWRWRGISALIVFTLLSASVAVELPPTHPAQAHPLLPYDPACPAVTDDERDFVAGLSDSEELAAYCQVLKDRRHEEERIRGEIQAAYDRTLLHTAVASLLVPLLVVAATFVFLTGPVLQAYHEGLERREETES